MKKVLTITFWLVCLSFNVNSQDRQVDSKQYQRSSLHNVLIQSESFPNSDLVMSAYEKSPFPDKYNDHRVELNEFYLSDYVLSETEKEELGLNKSKVGSLIGEISSEASSGIVSDNSQVEYQINKFIKDKKLGNILVSKWFNMNESGDVDMSLIKERGSYSASDEDIKVANTTTRGLSTLENSGKDLIKNTFVVFTKMNFVSNEPIALVIRDQAYSIAQSMPELLQNAAYKKANKIYEKSKEGYSVWTYAWLYRLKWDDKIFTEFKKFLNDKKTDGSINFMNQEFLELEFIGKENATSLVTFSLKESRTEEQILNLSTIRNIDKVYAKLQKKYDVFKTKTPIEMEGKIVTAKIGLKEGLESGDKFEVLEESYDMKTKEITYKKVGTITVDKKMIWDNRFGAKEEGIKQTIDRTYFKGGKNLTDGMLIRQIK